MQIMMYADAIIFSSEFTSLLICFHKCFHQTNVLFCQRIKSGLFLTTFFFFNIKLSKLLLLLEPLLANL